MRSFAEIPVSDTYYSMDKVDIDYSPDPVQHEIDHQNNGGYNEKTGCKNPPGREQNYLRLRSRIGRRR